MKHLLLALALVLTGCATFKPGGNTYMTVGVVLETADNVMVRWADYVVAEEARIAALSDVGEQLEAKAALLRREGRVQNAYGKYVAAVRAAKIALKTALRDPTEAPADVGLVSALNNLVATATP